MDSSVRAKIAELLTVNTSKSEDVQLRLKGYVDRKKGCSTGVGDQSMFWFLGIESEDAMPLTYLALVTRAYWSMEVEFEDSMPQTLSLATRLGKDLAKRCSLVVAARRKVIEYVQRANGAVQPRRSMRRDFRRICCIFRPPSTWTRGPGGGGTGSLTVKCSAT